jgi:hypothetical protein
MMGTKKLSDIKEELKEFLSQLPGGSPQAWLTHEIESAKRDPKRDVRTLEALLAVFDKPAKKPRKSKAHRSAGNVRNHTGKP